jgi:hypothetical protein
MEEVRSDTAGDATRLETSRLNGCLSPNMSSTVCDTGHCSGMCTLRLKVNWQLLEYPMQER